MYVIQWIMLSLLPMISSESVNTTKYKILMLTSPLGSQSHSIYLHAIAKQLALHGHQVTFHGIGQQEATKGIETHIIDAHDYDEIKSKALFTLNSMREILRMAFIDFTNATVDAINKIYKDPLIMEFIQEPLEPTTREPKYDIVLIDYLVAEVYFPLVHHLGVHSIMVSSNVPLPMTSCTFDMPFRYFLNFIGLSDSMGIMSRTLNFLWLWSIDAFFEKVVFEMMEMSMRNTLPDLPSLQEMSGNVSFLMTGSPYSIKDAWPTTPSTINLGCVHCRPAEPLPQDLEDVMQGSGEHGAIYFSLGSIVESHWVPKEFLQKIINGLRQLPQTILWKGQLLNETNLSNFYIREWFPQQHVLAHPKLRLVIIHGGLQSMQEVSYHGCPILGFPLSTDNHYAMKVAKDNGNGEYLNWRTFSTDDFLRTITRMLTNSSYKEAALKTSNRIRDVLDSPSEQAAYWTEYVIRHKGAPFLKSDGNHLYWYQYFLLDVITLLVMVFAIIFILCSLALKFGFKAAEKVLDL